MPSDVPARAPLTAIILVMAFMADASNGKTLYRFDTGGSIGGGVISYDIDGKQCVATTSGVVSGFFGGSGTSAIIVFSLP